MTSSWVGLPGRDGPKPTFTRLPVPRRGFPKPAISGTAQHSPGPQGPRCGRSCRSLHKPYGPLRALPALSTVCSERPLSRSAQNRARTIWVLTRGLPQLADRYWKRKIAGGMVKCAHEEVSAALSPAYTELQRVTSTTFAALGACFGRCICGKKNLR